MIFTWHNFAVISADVQANLSLKYLQFVSSQYRANCFENEGTLSIQACRPRGQGAPPDFGGSVNSYLNQFGQIMPTN